jgi:hypothetical protein
MKITCRYEWVNCGKRCAGCPHGPYIYAYWRENGRLKKRYIGKPPSQSSNNGDMPRQPVSPEEQLVPDPRAAIFSDQTATLPLALEILGLSELPKSVKDLISRFRQRSKELHPDRGGSDHEMRLANCSYAYILATMRPD